MSEDIELYTWWIDLKDPRLSYFTHILKANFIPDINFCRSSFRDRVKEKKTAECNIVQRWRGGGYLEHHYFVSTEKHLEMWWWKWILLNDYQSIKQNSCILHHKRLWLSCSNMLVVLLLRRPIHDLGVPHGRRWTFSGGKNGCVVAFSGALLDFHAWFFDSQSMT